MVKALELLKQIEETRLKHLAGRHNQLSHGRGWRAGKSLALGNMTPEDQKVVLDTFNEIIKKHPELSDMFEGISTNKRSFDNPNREASSYEEYGIFAFNPDYAKILPNLKHEGVVPEWADLRYLVAHELGHALYYKREHKVFRELEKLYNSVKDPYGNNTVEPLTGNRGNMREVFADAFAFVNSGKKLPVGYNAKKLFGGKYD